MNLAKVDYFNDMDNKQLGDVFSAMVQAFDRYIKHSVKSKCPSESDFDDYLQEGLIYCWKFFRKDFYGYMHPTRVDPTGSKMSWDNWFYGMAKMGAMNYYRKLHPRHITYIKSFAEMPEWFDVEAEIGTYDLNTDALIATVEKIIDRQPSDISIRLKAYLAAGCSFAEANRILGIPATDGTGLTKLHWSFEVIKHHTLFEVDPRFRKRIAGSSFYNLTKYASDLRNSCMVDPKGITATSQAYEFILAGIVATGLDKKAIQDISMDDYLDLLNELKKAKYVLPVRPIVFKRRLTTLIDWFIDLAFLAENPLAQADVYRSKKTGEVVARPMYQPKFRANRSIVQLTLDGQFVREYKDTNEAVAAGFKYPSIRHCLSGSRQKYAGYRFAFADEVVGLAEVRTAKPKKSDMLTQIKALPAALNPVTAWHPNGLKAKTYADIKDAVAMGYRKELILRAARGGVTTGGYFWSFDADAMPTPGYKKRRVEA